MLKATLKIKEDTDIKPYAEVIGFLKAKAIGHKPVKARALTTDQVQSFIDSAHDELWLDVKVCIIVFCALIFSQILFQ